MKILTIILMITTLLMGAKLQMPDNSYEASGSVVDMVVQDRKLYCATNVGLVDVFDLKTHKRLQQVKVDQIKDFMGDLADAKVYSVDLVNKKMLLLSQAEQGYRRLYIYKNKKMELFIPVSLHLPIAKAKFLDENTVLLALLGDELISFDLTNKKENWRVQVSGSKFSDFVLNENKTKVVVADESGDLQIVSTKDGKHLQTLSGKNLDNVFQVDWKKDSVATAGQDRRCVVYDLAISSAYYKSTSFLIYSVGLSPSAKLAAFASDEQNNVTVFNTATKATVAQLGGVKMTLSKIVFINEKELLVASDDRVVNHYKLK